MKPKTEAKIAAAFKAGYEAAMKDAEPLVGGANYDTAYAQHLYGIKPFTPQNESWEQSHSRSWEAEDGYVHSSAKPSPNNEFEYSVPFESKRPYCVLHTNGDRLTLTYVVESGEARTVRL